MSDIHVMIDIETLGTGLDSVVTQICAVPFDRKRVYTSLRFNVYLDIDAQQDALRTVNGSTFQWWLDQSEEARERLAKGLSSAVSPESALLRMRNWPVVQQSQGLLPAGWNGFAGIWSKGPAFDLAMIDHLSIEFADGQSPMFGCFRNYRDVRTMEDYVSKAAREDIRLGVIGLNGDAAHDAVWDCMYQAKLVQAAWCAIGGQNINEIATLEAGSSSDFELNIPAFLRTKSDLEERHDLV
ncbi:MAG: 3'-5' exoribonuclease [Hyphomonas sp.]|nr:3'-5' exoribonuclease [Hyphomonas sp.]